ncbi:Ig-like domain-containing protein [Loigolactobacillus backii]|uniref:Ig-like domain-containing protein n=1 Tax=Loigolactobacillus backii TaxID=375175 RepID=UPI0007F0F79F|nr:Ig-like domain-containing protein [Loigolactobacillus backii]ANK59818.1 hypothetical protein AYR52_05815 [Loigolactobacillus backii]
MTLTVGQSKDMTITTDPDDATDATNVVGATTASSSDDTIGTIAAKTGAKGTFTVTGVKTGTATITFTSGSLTTTLALTVNDATEGD